MNTSSVLIRPRGLFSLLVGGAALMASATAAFSAKSELEIDASVDTSLKRFHKLVEGSEDVLKKAKGVLIMPNVKKGGFVVGGEWGRGALRVDGKTVAYYKLASASVGLQAGVQSKDIVIAFMTEDAVKKFQASKGWDAGVDGNIAIIKTGASQATSVAMKNKPVIGYIFGVKGLMGDLSLSGSKITKYVPKD